MSAYEPTIWAVEVTGANGTEHTSYGNGNGKAAHSAASDRSRAPEVDRATVAFSGCVTTYRNGIGRDATTDAEHVAALAAV